MMFSKINLSFFIPLNNLMPKANIKQVEMMSGLFCIKNRKLENSTNYIVS